MSADHKRMRSYLVVEIHWKVELGDASRGLSRETDQSLPERPSSTGTLVIF